MNIAQVADELYGLKPSEFTAARNERARAARGSGDRELAEAISRLRRPTVAAWLVNMLTRQAADLVNSVMELGEALREAQQAMAGDRLRELSTRRRELLARLALEARRVAARSGQQVGAQAEREAMGTFEAALVDPRVADAVRSGHLTSPFSYAGLGAADVDEEIEQPVSLLEWARSRGRGPGAGDGRAEQEPPKDRGRAGDRGAAADRGTGRERVPRPGARTQAGKGTRAARQTDRQQAAARQAAERDALAARRRAREAAEAEAELRAANEEVRQAQAALDDAERQVSRARDDHQAIRQRIEELEQRLEQATAQESQSLAALRQARRGRDAAARSLTASQRRLARAQAKAGHEP